MKVTVIGSGYYAKAISNVLLESDMKVTMWTEQSDISNVIVRKEINLTNSYEEALKGASLAFVLTGSKFVESVLLNMKKYIEKDTIIVLGSKGLKEDGTLFTELVREMFKENKYAVISGPTFAVDIASLEPVGFTIATDDKESFDRIKLAMKNVYLEYSSDIDAVEMAGSLKNAYAIGSGILNGLNYGISTRSLFITKALKEIGSIYKALGLNEYATMTLAGIGDLVLTCTSLNSRNFTFGTILSLEDDDEKKDYLKTNTVEGYENLKVYSRLFEEKDIEAPILDCIYRIVLSQEKVSKLIELILH